MGHTRRSNKEIDESFLSAPCSWGSACESLHQAMTWMRNNGYPDVRDWAPFMLIGDVTFDFGK